MKKLSSKLLVLVALNFLFAGIVEASLAERINAILGQSSQKKVDFSICIVKADTGVTEYEHDARNPLIPASNMKIITTASAMRYLGSDFVYKTKVGIQDSNLVIIGSGDPLFGDRQTDEKYDREPEWILDGIAKALTEKDVNSIKDIIVDTGIFDNELVHPSWPRDELNRSYACEVSGLNYNDNCIQMSVENVNGLVNISIDPQTTFVTIVNEVKPVSTGDKGVSALRTAQPNKLQITGTCKNKWGPFEVAIQRPAAFFGSVLGEYLYKNGINITGQFIEKASVNQNGFEQIAEYDTPISDCLERCNRDSLNFAAESLMKTIAAYNNPDDCNGSWPRGAELMGDYLKELGIDENGFTIDDGCGLSTQDKISAYIIIKVLLDVYKSSNWQMYKDSLAIGGVEGTGPVRKHFTEDEYKGKVLAKSGSLTEPGVNALSGVCVTENGDYLFSIISNKIVAGTRDTINDIVKAIIDEYDVTSE
jgi:D-alanyl-D-alanine carboxypeptidase/D-alanyl-D-alanine-endopeptidase (penicillin-binding protein 4)